MVPFYPGQIIQDAVAVLNFMGRQKGRAADLRHIVEGKLWQAAIVRSYRDTRESTGKIEQLLAGFIGVDLTAL